MVREGEGVIAGDSPAEIRDGGVWISGGVMFLLQRRISAAWFVGEVDQYEALSRRL